MPRPAKIWLRKQTGWYYTTISGEQVRLSKDRKEAQRLFHELQASKEDEPEPASRLGLSFRKLADEFLLNTQNEKSETVLMQQQKVLQSFCAFVKRTLASDLKGHMVTSWLRTRPTWNESTRSHVKKILKACLNWGVKQGHLAESPLRRMSSGKAARRDRVLTPEERKRIAEFVSPVFADFLFVVGQTGARPYTEIARLTASDIDFAAGTATLKRHKTAKKTGRPRVLFFPDEVLALLRRKCEEHPVGLLFRTRRGTGWNRSNSWKWFETIREKLGIDAFPYALRHTRITEAIINGVPVEVVAELVGNTPQVIHSNYAHVAKNQAALRAAAAKAVASLT